MRALVLDGDNRAALAIVRSLGSRGIWVSVGSEEPTSLAGSSRWCSERLVYPCPRSSPGSFGDWLVSTMASMPDAALYISGDVTMSIVGERRRELPALACASLPPQGALRVAMDKTATNDLAFRLGVPAPRSVVFERGDCVEHLDLCYPVAVKAAQSDVPYRSATMFARDSEGLERVVEQVLRDSGAALVQEVITGRGTAIFALCERGRPLVTFAHRRLIEKPPWGGVSVLCESIRPPQDALRYSLRILRELDWHGVAMVEFKLTAQGVPCLMEINARYWGSLELAVRAGVDFPYLALQHSMGETPKAAAARPASNRWVLGELDSFTTSMLGRSRGSRVADVISHIWSLRRGPCCEVERLSDPKPALYEHAAWWRTSASRIGSRWKGEPSSCDKRTSPEG